MNGWMVVPHSQTFYTCTQARTREEPLPVRQPRQARDLRRVALVRPQPAARRRVEVEDVVRGGGGGWRALALVRAGDEEGGGLGWGAPLQEVRGVAQPCVMRGWCGGECVRDVVYTAFGMYSSMKLTDDSPETRAWMRISGPPSSSSFSSFSSSSSPAAPAPSMRRSKPPKFHTTREQSRAPVQTILHTRGTASLKRWCTGHHRDKSWFEG